MTSDPLGDALIQIKNGYLSRKESVTLPHSKIKEELVKLMVKKEYIESIKVIAGKKGKLLKIVLSYKDKRPALTNVVRVSKPSLRVYADKNSILTVLGGLGFTIISTPSGLMTGAEARKRKIGGEVICKIW